MPKPVIKHKVFLGDSLSDRGILALNNLLALAGGLTGNSPRGRFANGFGWVDLLASFGMADLTIDEMRAKRKALVEELDNELDEEFIRIKRILTSIDENDLPALFKQFRGSFNLDNPNEILFKGERYIRSYAIGGATAADWDFSWAEIVEEPTDDFARLVLSNLDKQREELFKDDLKYGVTAEEKATTLVTDWAGANDLITVHDNPTNDIADTAVDARIANIEKLIAAGYRNFVLINLPDLSLTPRFQNSGNQSDIDNAHNVTLHFNERLAAKMLELKERYPECFFDVFDTNAIFTDAYHNPENYGFSQELLTDYFTESEKFEADKKNVDYQNKKITPDNRGKEHYMFWNNVHPSAYVQAVLGAKYADKYDEIFDYQAPKKPIYKMDDEVQEQFLDYKERLNRFSDHKVSDKQAWSMFQEMQRLEQVKQSQGEDAFRERFKRNRTILPLPAHVRASIDAIQEHANQLERQLVNTTIAKQKAAVLNKLLADINQISTNLYFTPKEKLQEILRLLNETSNNGIINTHQNPKLDTFFKEKEYITTSYELLNGLIETIEKSIQHASYRISILIQQVEDHAEELSKSNNSIAKDKAVVLNNLAIELGEAETDLQKIHSILEKYEDGENYRKLATHQNPTWDKFCKKESTRSQDLLKELRDAAYDARNLHIQEEADSSIQLH
ncbi:Secreted effector protein SseJ [Legionella massiliensis]|uniref:Secreted effector protein SseJ n=1 Tax=Legionella massiliensis TaxID=1034943 RepID=A0A078L4W6_9GAMM|nr:SGNH/GDSL hydrolase family protein [Legionella massiliensis]CDZ79119.1 Secreted effector protein SseJ [Legionella massiliensis]CEE14857.1 Secreted effector protein SseJ [Legionella massiliensis]